MFHWNVETEAGRPTSARSGGLAGSVRFAPSPHRVGVVRALPCKLRCVVRNGDERKTWCANGAVEVLENGWRERIFIGVEVPWCAVLFLKRRMQADGGASR